MNLLLSTLLLINSMLFYFLSSPILLILTLIFQTLLVCLNMKLIVSTSWLSLILFLIFIGGLMIMFIYIASLAPNNYASSFNHQTYFLLSLITLSVLSVYILETLMLHVPTINYPLKTLNITNLVLKMYSFMLCPSILSLMLYLLLTLTIAAQVVLMKKSSLRSMQPI